MSMQKEQCGQALVEGLMAILVLASIWVAVAWLGHLQDMALTAQHASRFAAFLFTRHANTSSDHGIRAKYFQGPAHRWQDRRGDSMLASPLQQTRLSWQRIPALQQEAQPGGQDPTAMTLRHDWQIQDAGVVKALVNVAPGFVDPLSDSTSVLGLEEFNIALNLKRHTAILEGAGHASNDLQVQHRVSESGLAWANSEQTSTTIGMHIEGVMDAVDAPWGRAKPVFDWLNPWAGHVPAERLASSLWSPS